jgi:hypothetical protein
MKARVKATGEIVEVHTSDDADFVDRNGKYYWEHELFFGSLDVSSYDDPDYWTRLEHQAAIGAMQGMLANANHYLWERKQNSKSLVANAAELAHALVEKLKSSDL